MVGLYSVVRSITQCRTRGLFVEDEMQDEDQVVVQKQSQDRSIQGGNKRAGSVLILRNQRERLHGNSHYQRDSAKRLHLVVVHIMQGSIIWMMMSADQTSPSSCRATCG